MAPVHVRAVAAGALVLWAGALVYDMNRLKQSPEFQRSDLGSGTGSVRMFGVRLDGAPKEE
jgi:hypothetical protein